MAKKYKFKIENETHDWDEQFISGAQVRQQPPGIPENFDLFLKEKGKTGRLINNLDRVDLADPGIEKFYAQETRSGAGAYGTTV